MPGSTSYLELKTYNTITDASSILIYDFIDDTSGCSVTSNVGIIDQFAENISASIATVSASMLEVTSRTNNTHSAVIQIVNPTTTVDASSGLFYLRAPSEINGMNLYRAQAFVNTASASGTSASMTVQVRNMTKYLSNDALSTPIIIGSASLIGTPGIINTSYDDVSTDDQIKIYVVDVSSGSPKGLQTVLEYVYP